MSDPSKEARSAAKGSRKPGPSSDFRALLRGEIDADEYVRRLKADVDARLRADREHQRRWRLIRGR